MKLINFMELLTLKGLSAAPKYPSFATKLHMMNTHHCSPEPNLVNLRPPEEPTTDSESSRHEDFKNDLEDAVTSCATI